MSTIAKVFLCTNDVLLFLSPIYDLLGILDIREEGFQASTENFGTVFSIETIHISQKAPEN